MSKYGVFTWPVFSCIRTEYGPNAGKYEPVKTPYLDTFHAMRFMKFIKLTVL